jgi:Ser/Thr protein kinase RdoA (MazF antagonist)
MSGEEAAAALFGPPFGSVRWTRRGGGFSGSLVFAGTLPGDHAPAFCLKGWPPGVTLPDRPSRAHSWMGRVAHLPFVPKVFPATSGRTWVESGGRLWELTGWMPGVADFREHPSDARLAAACRAIAELHRGWCPAETTSAPFPAVARRLALLRDWRATAPGPVGDHPDLAETVRLARAVLPRWVDWAEQKLAPGAKRPVSVQPCLCDVHHDHVLFTGDDVTGVIDYGAMKPDHPAVDLARLLGDLVPDDADRRRLGLDAYHAAGGSAGVTAELVELLDRTGTVCAAANWLLRLATGQPTTDPAAVAVRLGRLVRRLERGFTP